MAIQPGVWGIDLGQCALKAIRLEVIDGQVTATAFDYVEHPKILSQPDADPDQLIREALETFLSRNSLKGDTVAISVPGQSGLARFVKLPPVEEKKITDIVRFEAKQQIPFNLDEVVWDFQKITSGVVSDGFAMETEIGLFAMKRDMVSRYLGHFKEVNVEVHLVQMAPLALCNYVSYDLLQKNVDGSGGEETTGGKKRCVTALDIGADSSNLVITDGQRIIWQRPIPLGGNHFTRALTKDLKLTFAKAEHLKRNATKSPDLKKILAALKPVLNDFVGEVQRSLGYFTNTHRDAQVEYMVGLGNAFRLPGLQRFLAEKLQLDVRRLTKFDRLAGDEVINQPTYTENLASLAVAYGLGLQGLKQARLQTNLLPPEIQVERMVRAKKPMAAAAAAAMLLGVSLLTLGYAMEIRAYGSISNDPSNIVEKAKADAKAAVDKDKKLETAYNTLKGEVAKEETEVKSLIAGKDERLNWLALHKFIADCLPRVEPNGDLYLLNPQAKKMFWDAKAKLAWKLLQDRLASAKGPLGKDDIVKEFAALPTVNITGFDCRYTASMADFWNNLKIDDMTEVRDSVRAPRAPAGDKSTVPPPEAKPGWVIELRGYTYNDKRRDFIIDGLVDNIAIAGGAPEQPKDAKTDSKPAATGASSGGAGATATAPSANAPAAEENKDPVKGHISHVCLYRYIQVPAASPFSLAASGELASLAGGTGGGRGEMGGLSSIKAMAGGGASGGPSGGMAGAGGASGGMAGTGGPSGALAGTAGAASGGAGGSSGGTGVANWAPLLAAQAGGGSTSTGLPGTPVGGAGTRLRGGLALDSSRETTAKTDETNKDDKPPRCEFVVLFFWQEPTPSDSLMQFKAPDPSAAAGAGGGAGATGGFSKGSLLSGAKQ
jgi:type IV pilus assembly protein PilM